MANPLSISKKTEVQSSGCFCCVPKKKHEKTKEKIDQLPIPELIEADQTQSNHKRMPTPYPRDAHK